MESTILYPMVAQSALTFGVLSLLAKRRFAAIADKSADYRYFRLFSGDGEPDHVRVVQRNLLNLFEMPMLFFIICLMAEVFGKADTVMVYAAWGYVAVRVLHSITHIVQNNVQTRFQIFMVSNIILMFMWVWVLL